MFFNMFDSCLKKQLMCLENSMTILYYGAGYFSRFFWFYWFSRGFFVFFIVL